MTCSGRQLQLFHNAFLRAAGHLAAVAENGEDQRMHETARRDARVGKIMQRAGAFGVQELHLDVKVNFLAQASKIGT